jgi:uncharacterized membrane protein YdjX (TVP38/TMEM64 family)
VVDDRLLHIGSANLNNRSMGTDTECDIAIEAADERQRAGIVSVRNRLIADHCGVRADEVAAALSGDGSLLALADRLGGDGHALEPIDDGVPDDAEWAITLQELADPEKPIEAEEFVGRMLGGLASRRSLATIAKVTAAGLVVLGLVLAWEFSPLSELAQPERVRRALQSFGQGAWGPLVILIVFTGASLLLFPITILIAATAAAFGPWLGFTYSAVGAIASALASFAIGALIGRKALSDMLGPRLNRIRQKIRRKGVLAVAVLRMVPVAPFGIVNLVAGASEIRLTDFVLGTAVGMLPGIAAMSALGHQITYLMAHPSPAAFGWLALAVTGWIALSFGLQAAVSKFAGNRR